MSLRGKTEGSGGPQKEDACRQDHHGATIGNLPTSPGKAGWRDRKPTAACGSRSLGRQRVSGTGQYRNG